VLRLLLPQKDRERAIYGLKEKNIAKTYIKMIPLGPKDPDAVRLLEWRKPSGPNVGSSLGGSHLSANFILDVFWGLSYYTI
jgi:DNA ligase 4